MSANSELPKFKVGTAGEVWKVLAFHNGTRPGDPGDKTTTKRHE